MRSCSLASLPTPMHARRLLPVVRRLLPRALISDPNVVCAPLFTRPCAGLVHSRFPAFNRRVFQRVAIGLRPLSFVILFLIAVARVFAPIT